MKIIELILWIIVFIVDTISFMTGNEPNWILVYCPLVTVLCHCMNDIVKNRH